MPRFGKYNIAERKYFNNIEDEPKDLLQCNTCGGFFSPCKFQREKKNDPVRYIRRNFCIRCPDDEDEYYVKRKATFNDLNVRIMNLEKEVKEIRSMMNSNINGEKNEKINDILNLLKKI